MSVVVTDFKAESITRLSSDQCAGLSAPRSPWPLFARFEARKPLGRPSMGSGGAFHVPELGTPRACCHGRL